MQVDLFRPTLYKLDYHVPKHVLYSEVIVPNSLKTKTNVVCKLMFKPLIILQIGFTFVKYVAYCCTARSDHIVYSLLHTPLVLSIIFPGDKHSRLKIYAFLRNTPLSVNTT